MKKIFCLAFVLLAAVGVLAQEKTIEKAEFDPILRNSYGKYAGQSYRRTINFEDLPTVSNPRKMTRKTVMEFAATRGSRSISEVDSPAIKKKTERIMIGGKIYTRTNDGDWTEEKLEVPEKKESPLKPVEEEIEYKSLGAEKLNGQSANVYAKIQRQKRVDEARNSETLTTITTKYWFGEDGGILKEETLYESRIKSEKRATESVFRNLRVSVWEIDPNIKIEAPIPTK